MDECCIDNSTRSEAVGKAGKQVGTCIQTDGLTASEIDTVN